MASFSDIFGDVVNTVVLVVLLVFIVLFSFLFSIYFLRVFMAEEDKSWKVAIIPKIIFVISFTTCVFGTLLVPWSVISYKFDLNDEWYYWEEISYQIYFAFVLLLILVVIPFSCVYYETEDPYHKFSFVKQAICGGSVTCIIVTIFMFLFICSYFFIGRARISYVYHQVSLADSIQNSAGEVPSDIISFQPTKTCYTSTPITSTVLVSFVIYMVAMVVLVGYALFVVVGGLGMSALPLCAICGFFRRPKPLKAKDYLAARNLIRERTEKLLQIGEKIDRKISLGKMISPKDRLLFQDFKRTAAAVTDDWRLVKFRYRAGGAGVIISYLRLIYGFFAIFVSILWILQVFFFLAIEPTGWNFAFLNYVLMYIDYLWGGLPILGTVLYGILVSHLLFAMFAGSTEVLGRIPLISLYPLKKGDTMMNSLLMNVEIFLLVGLAVNQFCCYCFEDFAANSILNLFGRTIQNLQLFYLFYKWTVQYAFLIFVVIGFFFALISNVLPRKKSKNEKDVNRVVRTATGGFSLLNYIPFVKNRTTDGMTDNLLDRIDVDVE